MKWYEVVKKNQILYGYYDPVPDLKKVEVNYILMGFDILINLHMPIMPNKQMPAKWYGNNYNRILLEIGCYNAKNGEFDNWNFHSENKIFDINLNLISENVSVNCISSYQQESISSFSLTCSTAYIKRLEPIILNDKGYY